MHAPLDKLCPLLHRHFLPIPHLYDHTLFVQLSLLLPMKFLLRLLWAQNGFVNNQTHKHSRSSCMFFFLQLHKRHFINKNFRTVFDWPKIMFQSISRPFENDDFMHWRCASYTRNPLWHYQHSKLKNWAGQKILRLIPCLFENHTFCAFASRTRDYNFFCSRTSRKTTSAA